MQCSGSDVMQYLLPPHSSSSFRPWVRLNCQRCIACVFCVWVCACLCVCATTKEVDATPNFFKQCVLYVPVCVRCVHCAISVVLCNGPQRCYTTEGLDQGHRHCCRFSSLSLSLSLAVSNILMYSVIALQHVSTVPLKKPYSVYRISVIILRNIRVKE